MRAPGAPGSAPAARGGIATPFHDALLVLWLALISADRIDLMGGDGPFVLTPFLVLTPVVLLSEAVRVGLRGRAIHWGGGATRYLVLCSSLLAVVFLSVLLGLDVAVAARRAGLLLALVAGTAAVALTLVRRPGVETVLVRGAKLGLVLAVVLSVWQVTFFLSGSAEPIPFLGFATLSLATGDYAGWVPRLSGQVADMNRAGFLYVFYLYVLLRWGGRGMRNRAWVGVALLLVLATLSRSSLLALAVTAVVLRLESRDEPVSGPALAAGAAVLALLAAWALLDPFGVETVGRTLRPLEGRFSLAEGSARSHFELLVRGVAEASGSIKRALIGIGYGNSFLVLQDVFPGNPYGNFHSLYVTFLAESGVFAFLLVLVLFGWPLARGGPARPLLAGLVAYNVFYQAGSEPLLWFVLAWAWLTLPAPPGLGRSGADDQLVGARTAEERPSATAATAPST